MSWLPRSRPPPPGRTSSRRGWPRRTGGCRSGRPSWPRSRPAPRAAAAARRRRGSADERVVDLTAELAETEAGAEARPRRPTRIAALIVGRGTRDAELTERTDVAHDRGGGNASELARGARDAAGRRRRPADAELDAATARAEALAEDVAAKSATRRGAHRRAGGVGEPHRRAGRGRRHRRDPHRGADRPNLAERESEQAVGRRRPRRGARAASSTSRPSSRSGVEASPHPRRARRGSREGRLARPRDRAAARPRSSGSTPSARSLASAHDHLGADRDALAEEFDALRAERDRAREDRDELDAPARGRPAGGSRSSRRPAPTTARSPNRH